MFGGKKQPPAQVYVEQLWKGVARSTLLEAQLHISNLKPQQRHHDGYIYPQWWGHEEYHQEGYSQAFAQRKKSVEQQQHHSTGVDSAVSATTAQPAGLKSQRGPTPIFPVVCDHFPKKMIDENTQTDDSTIIFASYHLQKPPLASKIPISSYSGFLNGGEDAVLGHSPAPVAEMASSPLKSPSKAAKKPSVAATKVAKKFVPRRASANLPSASILTELSASNSAIFSSLLKEAAETPLELSFSTNVSVKQQQQQAPPHPTTKAATSMLPQQERPLNTLPPFSLAPTVKSISSPFPERSVPPVNGTFSISTNFLNGPIVSLLELDGIVSGRNHGAVGIADQSLLLNSTSFWLDQGLGGLIESP